MRSGLGGEQILDLDLDQDQNQGLSRTLTSALIVNQNPKTVGGGDGEHMC